MNRTAAPVAFSLFALILAAGCAQPQRCTDPLPFGPMAELPVGEFPWTPRLAT
jgi:hypothetical protein